MDKFPPPICPVRGPRSLVQSPDSRRWHLTLGSESPAAPLRLPCLPRPFGFESNGVIDVKVSDWKVYLEEGQTSYDRRKLGFFITTAEAETQLQQDLESGGCVLDSKNVELLFTFNDMESEKKQDSTYEYPGRIPPDQGGEYSLFFANCQSHVDVSARIHVEMYNEAWSGSRDFLSAGEAPLPTVYLVMAVFYLLAALIWAGVLYQNRTTVLKIHYLMLSLVVFKCLSTACAAGMYHMKRLTGQPDGWNIAFYIFSFVRGILLFSVIVLIGTGWSFLKPFLSDKEKKVRFRRMQIPSSCSAASSIPADELVSCRARRR